MIAVSAHASGAAQTGVAGIGAAAESALAQFADGTGAATQVITNNGQISVVADADASGGTWGTAFAIAGPAMLTSTPLAAELPFKA